MGMNLRPARLVPPGRIIRRELDARGWTQKELAEIMGRPEQLISQIVNARKQITPETALQLAAAFGTSAELWLNLESEYQVYQARRNHNPSPIERRSRLHSLVPLTEIIRRGWIEAKQTVDELEAEVCSFLDIPDPQATPRLTVNFRHSAAYDPEASAELAWIKRVDRLARQQTVASYESDRLGEEIELLLALTRRREDVTAVPGLLREWGIHFIIVPHLQSTYLDGAVFRLDDHPVIALTLRYDRVDNFWFTLLHELAHIVAGHTGGFLDNLEEEAETAPEIEADRTARDWLLDPVALQAFVQAKSPRFSNADIEAFAAEQGRHPGIVAGRLQHDKVVPYTHFRRLLESVSTELEPWKDVPEPSMSEE